MEQFPSPFPSQAQASLGSRTVHEKPKCTEHKHMGVYPVGESMQGTGLAREAQSLHCTLPLRWHRHAAQLSICWLGCATHWHSQSAIMQCTFSAYLIYIAFTVSLTIACLLTAAPGSQQALHAAAVDTGVASCPVVKNATNAEWRLDYRKLRLCTLRAMDARQAATGCLHGRRPPAHCPHPMTDYAS